MKRLTALLGAFLILLLCACGAETAQQPEPTPALPAELCGDWTAETGDGSLIWSLTEDGTARIPIQENTALGRMGGYGSWSWEEATQTVTVDFGKRLQFSRLEEDGFSKLFCPELNVTLVRTADYAAAREQKFVTVELTDENVWDYFILEQVPAPVDETGARIYKEVFVMRNAQYDNGLLYWDEQDVNMEFIYWTTYDLNVLKAPYGVNFYVNTFNSVKASGTLTFIRSDYVQHYNYTGTQRTLTLCTGETKTETFTQFRYGNYPY